MSMTYGADPGAQAQRVQPYQEPVAAVGTAGNDLNTDVMRCPTDGVITAVYYVPASTVTGANTNTRKVQLVNKGQAGAGTTVIASIQFDSGVNAPADQAKAVTLSGTAANKAVVAGDILQWQSVHVGTGITDPGGLVYIETSRY